ncbi:MAG: M15 family metallopeptidase [Spirochaetaceae bacterium]|jgi:hypothetical protein|nr:M15 family metallopeptidase [Spirochaetaceae bacterium]
MKKPASFLLVLGLILVSAPVRPDPEDDLAILAAAYPGAFEIDGERGLRFPGGILIPYDDGKEKDFAALLDDPDLEDMLSLPYPLGEAGMFPARNYDPGRFRPHAFFRALYGGSEEEVRARLRPVQWMPSLGGPRLLMSTRFGVDTKLEAVIAGLETLGPEYRRYLLPPGGGFNYRPIAGSRRLSAHSFGIAVDIAVGPSHYWQWEPRGAEEYRNAIPQAIVAIFEKQGFIWGGKWYHFDTMHFEYRPELILKARLSAHPVSQPGRRAR